MSVPDVETFGWCGAEIVVEWDLVNDAIREVLGVFDRVRFRHGARFRRLERLIETACRECNGTGPWFELEPFRYVVGVPTRLAEIVAEARRLKV